MTNAEPTGASPGTTPAPAVASLWHRIAWNRHGAVRVLWRLLLFAGVFAACGWALGFLVRPLLPDDRGLRFLARSLVSLVAALAATWAVARTERRPFGSVGLGRHPGFLRDLALGSLGGAALVLATAAVEVAGGALSIARGHAAPASLATTGLGIFVLFVAAGTVEELVFRGAPFQMLVGGVGPGGSVALTSLVFGLAHLGNPNPTVISTANTALAGVFLALAYLKTRSLWLPVGLHWSWNFTMGFVCGLPVSGITLESPSLFEGTWHGPVWLSGAGYGPEGGAALTLVATLACILLWRTRALGLAPGMPVFRRGAGPGYALPTPSAPPDPDSEPSPSSPPPPSAGQPRN